MRIIAVLAAALLLSACAVRLNSHKHEPADLGTPVTAGAMLESLSQPGVMQFEKIDAADWHFPYTTRAKGTEEWTTRQLNAHIYFYAINHPRFGLYLIDAGMPADYEAHMGPILRRVVRNDYALHLTTPTEAWITANNAAPRGAFITHLHYDHVEGVSALPQQTPIYVGPGEGSQKNFFHRFISQPTRDALKGRPPLREWRMGATSEGELAALDVFGDGSVFAIHVPGHTPGSMAFIVNSTTGPQLVTGDAVHSAEGWRDDTEEATGFEKDVPQVLTSIAALKALAARIPNVTVHPGHQSMVVN